MRLEDRLRQTIHEYPSLYRVQGDPRLSRLLALEHMFLGIGNEYEWHPSGYLADTDQYKTYGKVKFPALPDGFFDMENLYCVDVDPSALDVFKAAVAGRFHYIRREGRGRTIQIRAVVQASEAETLDLMGRFGEDRRIRPRFAHEARVIRFWDDAPIDLSPHSISEYSPIVEMTRGRTNSVHVDNFGLDGIIRADYIAGAVEIVEEVMAYYATPSRFKQGFRYPGKTNGCKTKREWDAYVKGEKSHLKAFLKKFRAEVVAS